MHGVLQDCTCPKVQLAPIDKSCFQISCILMLYLQNFKTVVQPWKCFLSHFCFVALSYALFVGYSKSSSDFCSCSSSCSYRSSSSSSSSSSCCCCCLTCCQDRGANELSETISVCLKNLMKSKVKVSTQRWPHNFPYKIICCIEIHTLVLSLFSRYKLSY